MIEPESAKSKGRPRVGDRVRDTATDQVGILQGVYEYTDASKPKWLQSPPKLMAFIRPEGGGLEWMTDPKYVKFPD